MLVRKIELNPWRRLIWVWIELYLIPKRYHLKENRLDYQSLFRKGARALGPHLRDQRKWSRETEIRAFLLLFLRLFVKDTLTAKNSGVSLWTPWMRHKSLTHTPKRLKRDEEHPRLFHMVVPPRARMFVIGSDGFITREQVNCFYSLLNISFAQTTNWWYV